MSLFQQSPVRYPLQGIPHRWGANPLAGPAVAPALIACDAWDTYGAQASIAQGNFTPYQAHPNASVSNGTISIVALANPPWNPNGSGSYLHVVPGSNNVPNAGTGMYLNFGNPHRSLLCGFWFRPIGFTGSGGGPFIFRWNRPLGQDFGTDIETVSVNSSGNIVFGGAQYTATSTQAFTANTWYFVELYIQFGAGGSATIPGEMGINVNSTPWLAATNISTGAGYYAAPSITFDNEFSSSNMDFGPWYLLDPGTHGMQAALSSGGNMFFNTYLPSGNDSVQFTPSTGTNYSNVNSAPAGSAYNAGGTQGLQDTYSFTIPTLGNVVGASILTQVEKDAIGERIALPVWKSGSTVVTGSLGTGAALVNGTYAQMQDARLLSPFTGVAFTSAEISAMTAGVIVQA